MLAKTYRGLKWAGSGFFVRNAARFLTMALLARLLTPSDFGIYGALLVVLGVVDRMVQLGLAQALVQKPVVTEAHWRGGAFSCMALGGAASLCLWFGEARVCAFFEMEALGGALRICAGLPLVASMNAVLSARVQRDLEFALISRVMVVSQVLGYCAVSVGLGWWGCGVNSLAWGHVAQAVLEFVAFAWASGRLPWAWPHVAELLELLRYGVGASLLAIATAFAVQLDNLCVGRYCGAEELGLYSRAYYLLLIPVGLLAQPVGVVMFPVLSKVQSEREVLATSLRLGVGVVGALVLPAGWVAMVLGPELVEVVYGPGWEGAVGPFRVLAVCMFFVVLQTFLMNFARARGWLFRATLYQVVYASVVGAGAWWVTSRGGGGVEVALTTSVAIVIHYGLFSWLALEISGLSAREYVRAHAPGVRLGVLAALIAGGVAEVGRRSELPGFVTLVAAGGVLGVGGASLLWWQPERWLGEPGGWLSNRLRGRS